MAILWIAEFKGLGVQHAAGQAISRQCLQYPPERESTLEFGALPAVSAPFLSETRVVALAANRPFHLRYGGEEATEHNFRFEKGALIGVESGAVISVVEAE